LAFAAPDAALTDADDAVLESRITRATAGYHWPYAFQLRDLDACAPRGPEADRNGDVCWIVAYRAGGFPMNFVDVARIEIGPDGAGAGEFFIGAPFAADSTYSAVILGPANEVVSNAVSFEVVADDGGAVVAAATLR